jgi:HK97 family phage prohead protease
MPSTKKNATKQHFNLQVKAIGADGSFEGILAVYNNVDLGGDSILPGAFTKTIQEHGNEVPMLWQHETDEPIGSLTLTDSPDALLVKGQLLMELPMAQKAYLLLKARIIKGLSIGYDTVKKDVEGGVRKLKEIRLWEGSVVTFPMNPLAMVTAIKALREKKDDFNTELAEIQLRDTGDQLFCALRYATCSLPWQSGMSKDQKVSAAETTLQQFTEAYLAFLPLYIDYLEEQYGDMSTMSAEEIETKQRKSGREISAANMKTLKEAHGHVKSLDDIFEALIDDPADDDEEEEGDKSGPGPGSTPPATPAATAEAKAATTIAEPVIDHSALNKISNLKELFQWKPQKSS